MYHVPYLTNFAFYKAAVASYYRHEGTVLDFLSRTRAGMLLLSLFRSQVKPSKPQELEMD